MFPRDVPYKISVYGNFTAHLLNGTGNREKSDIVAKKIKERTIRSVALSFLLFCASKTLNCAPFYF